MRRALYIRLAAFVLGRRHRRRADAGLCVLAGQGSRRGRRHPRQHAGRLRPGGRPERHGRHPEERAVHPAEPPDHARAAGRQHARHDDADQERRRRDGDGQPSGFRRARHTHRRFGQCHGRRQESPGRHACWSPRCSARTDRSMPWARDRSRSAASPPGRGRKRLARRADSGSHFQRRHRRTRNRLHAGERTHAAPVAAQSRPHHCHRASPARSTPIWAARSPKPPIRRPCA